MKTFKFFNNNETLRWNPKNQIHATQYVTQFIQVSSTYINITKMKLSRLWSDYVVLQVPHAIATMHHSCNNSLGYLIADNLNVIYI